MLSLAAGIMICTALTNLQAQNSKVKLENVVNDEFGTLLQSLLTDGKLDETNAKTYLQTVFGYNDAVNNYLQTANLSQQINNIKQGNMSLDNYLGVLSNSLIDLVPEKYRSEIESNLQLQSLINGSIKEIASGNFGENSLQLIDGIIRSVKEDRERIAKEKLLLEKIKAITPTLNSLSKTTSPKKEKYSVSLVTENWKEIANPDWSKKTGRLSKATITNNGIEFEGEWKNFNPPTYQFAKYFRNTEKFDFSKDFKAVFEVSVDNSNNYNFFEIQLAGMYQMQLMFYKTSAYTFTTPKKYFFTNKYGVFYNTMYTQTAGFKNKIIRNKDCVDFTKSTKITMEKIGNVLTFKFNDCTETSEIEMDYFYNKYALDFRAEGKVTLHSMTLEHL